MDNDKTIQPVNLQLIPAYHQDDEISLFDIFRVLVNFKYHIVVITFICMTVALIYSLLASPVYKANVYFGVVNSRDIAGLNVGIISFSTKQAHNSFISNFNSRLIRRHFFDENNLINLLIEGNVSNKEQDNIFENKFNGKLSLEYKNNKDILGAYYLASNAEYSSEWLNKFIDYVNDVTVDSMKQDMSKIILFKKERLNEEIDRKRRYEMKRKKDVESILTEAHIMARNLNIKEGFLSPSPEYINIDQQIQIYNRGYDALSEELRILRTRKDDTPFIDGIREIESELEYLDYLAKKVTMDTSSQAVIIEQYANVPQYRIKPKRKQVMIIGLFVGLFLGVVVVFILNLFEKMRKQEQYKRERK